ncbi:MAG: hypothetical protein AB7V15_05485 [Acidimicrobiia bacterium]
MSAGRALSGREARELSCRQQLVEGRDTMAEALLMEFDPQDGKDARQEYATVMTELALGDEIPAGAISHAAVVSAAGGLVVFELW